VELWEWTTPLGFHHSFSFLFHPLTESFLVTCLQVCCSSLLLNLVCCWTLLISFSVQLLWSSTFKIFVWQFVMLSFCWNSHFIFCSIDDSEHV
jgi:hypothetical protein